MEIGGEYLRKKEKLSAIILAVMIVVGYTKNSVVIAANDFTVTQAKAVLYSVGNTPVYITPDLGTSAVLTLSANLPIEVLGVTSNGWFQVNINGTYYIQGSGLKQTPDSTNIVKYDEAGIKQLTKGTFTFFKNADLRNYNINQVQEMDDNTYIKYLDSFIIGNAMVDYCIIKENGLTLRSQYNGLSAANSKVSGLTIKEYLISYRNDYLTNSLWGPIRTQKEMKQVLTRAIRYEKNIFGTVFKSANIGSDEKEMNEFLKQLVEEVKDEQGVAFAYKMEYGSYKTSEGTNASGWIIDFSYK